MLLNINLTPIIQAIITLLAALITYKLIPWIKARTSEAQQNNLRAAVRVLIFAAEQIYGAGQGKEKLEYVKEKLAEAGYAIDIDEIEAAVGEYLNGLGDAWVTKIEEEYEPPDEEEEEAEEE